MSGHGSQRGMSLIKMARLKGETTYHGKACGCGSTLRKVETRACALCNGKSKEAREDGKFIPVNLFAMASAAFKVSR